MRALILIPFVLSINSCGTLTGKKDDSKKDSGDRAVNTLAELRTFVGEPSTYVSKFETAERLSVHELPLGTAIDSDECENLKQQVISAYEVNPFYQETKNGAVTSDVCGVESFLLERAVEVASGAKATRIIQNRVYEFRRVTIRSLFLNDGFKVVHRQSVTNTRDDEPVMSGYSIDALLDDGLYGKSHLVNLADEELGITGPETKVSFSAIDGEVILALRRFHQDAEDASKSDSYEQYKKASRQDWSRFYLVPTYGIFGALYGYDGVIHQNPNAYRTLEVFYSDGSETCAEGLDWQGEKVTSFYGATGAQCSR